MENTIYTIGHSNHPSERFLQLLDLHAITAVADVRSTPYSRFNRHFDRESLTTFLASHSIRYVFLGDHLGARTDDPHCYIQGKVSYDRLAQTPLFQRALARLQKGSSTQRIALMCAEKEPLDCHRSILVARHLDQRGTSIQHILEDGRLESQSQLLSRLAHKLNLRQDLHLFRTPEDQVTDAYTLQEARIAYQLEPGTSAA